MHTACRVLGRLRTVTSARQFLALALAAAVMVACSGGATATASPSTPASAGPTAVALPSASTPIATGSMPSPTMPPETPSPGPFTLTSPAFDPNGPIPAEYTCRGADRSPALDWSGVPAGSQALVLFVDDPDGRDWVHWSVLDLDPSSPGLSTGIAPAADPPQQGTNDFGKVGYGGPCPPSGTHHYHFTLYALPAPLGLQDHPNGKSVRAALAKASPIAKITLIGTVAH